MTPLPSTCPDKRGFTLAESVVTVALCSIFFVITAVILGNAYRILRQERYKVAAQQGVQLALNRLTCELREAKAITSVGNPLVFTKVDPSLNRFLSLANFNQTLTVTYQSSANQLTRNVTPGGTAQIMADGVVGFVTSIRPSGNIEVQMTFMDERQAKTYITEIAVPSTW